jgi:sec-independent protein translocase protein TatA
MGIGLREILIIAVVFILLFGRGKISEMMGDVAKGIKSFKKGIADDDAEAKSPPSRLDAPQSTVVDAEKQGEKLS